MSTVATGPAALHVEGSLSYRVLPRCWNCGHKHPAAYNPPLEDQRHCPACGHTVQRPREAVEVPVAITDRAARFGMALIRAGAWLIELARRM